MGIPIILNFIPSGFKRVILIPAIISRTPQAPIGNTPTDNSGNKGSVENISSNPEKKLKIARKLIIFPGDFRLFLFSI